MDSKDQGFSIEASITTSAAFLLLLIQPEQPAWRIIILTTSGLLLLNVVRKSRWAKRTNPILTLKDEPYADDDDTFLRKIPACTLVILGIVAFGVLTWPPKPIDIPGDGVLFYSPAETQLHYHPTPNGILPSKPDAKLGSETKRVTGPTLGATVKGVKTPLIRPAAPNAPTALSITVVQ
jgi:hypothetical protein